MQKHITILGVLYIAFGALGICVAAVVFLGVAGGGLLSGDTEAMAMGAGVGSLVALLIILFSAPGIIGGIGLLKRWPWARILVLILGCLNILNIPFGTILGIYTIWVLMQSETTGLFTSRSN